jgi:hypothetical protein
MTKASQALKASSRNQFLGLAQHSQKRCLNPRHERSVHRVRTALIAHRHVALPALMAKRSLREIAYHVLQRWNAKLKLRDPNNVSLSLNPQCRTKSHSIRPDIDAMMMDRHPLDLAIRCPAF